MFDWRGGRKAQERGNIYAQVADSLCIMQKLNNIVKQLYSNKKSLIDIASCLL